MQRSTSINNDDMSNTSSHGEHGGGEKIQYNQRHHKNEKILVLFTEENFAGGSMEMGVCESVWFFNWICGGKECVAAWEGYMSMF